MKSMMKDRTGNKYAVIDLEATGTGSNAKIIQIGIVIVQDGHILETYECDINPHEKLDRHIQELTGITNQQLEKAPDFSEVARDIYERVEDAIFVAHNVAFDANLLAEALFFEGFELRTPRVDTVELAQVFFPTFEKYNLGILANALDLELSQAHTAIEDAMATAGLLLKIQEKIAGLPKQTVEQLQQLADNLLYESRLVIDEVYDKMTDQVAVDLEMVHGLALKIPKERPVAKHLSQDFEMNVALLGLDARAPQRQFAQLIEERLVEDGRAHFIQAQAGIGKTYGYLLPLLAHADTPVAVVVPTKVLQEQIVTNEGRRLEEVFGVSVVSVKSPRHYLHLERYYHTLEREDENRLMNRFKMQILVWLCETETGDLDELQQKQRYQSYFNEIGHDGFANEQGLFGQWDFWHRLSERAKSSQVLVTNHAYFLHHVHEGEGWFDQRVLVVDEAQKFLMAVDDWSHKVIDVLPLMQQLCSKRDRSKQLLEKRLYEACIFEVDYLLQATSLRGGGQVDEERIASLHQHLLELDDHDFDAVIQMLKQYDEFWLEELRYEDKRVRQLRASFKNLINVGSLLHQSKIFFISATLELTKRLNIGQLMGFETASLDCLPSTKVERQVILHPTDMPDDLMEWDVASHANWIVETLKVVQKGQRPTLVLFTSIALLLAVSERLEQEEIDHLAQHKHGAESFLKRRFEKGETNVLLGTGAFWQGVDFSGRDDMLQILVRLPFDQPKDRFVQKVTRRLREEGKHPFFDYGLPMMMLRLKQAIGRTKRSETQMSAVVLLDPRLQTKSYGKQVFDFLEKEYDVQRLPLVTIPTAVESFFKKQGKEK